MDSRTTGYIVSRSFRGSQLFLTAYSDKPLSFHWLNDRSKSQVFESSAAALKAADRAAREYGAKCAVIDPNDNLLEPAKARPSYPYHVRAFNTGRQYTARGQRIGWVVLSTGNVAMVDVDRMIDYVLTIEGEPTNAKVLAAYDAYAVVPFNGEEWEESRRLESAMRAKALAV